MFEYGVIVHLRLRLFPFGFDLIQGLLGLVRIFVERGNQIPVPDDLDAIYFSGICYIYALQRGVMGGRPQNPGIQHAGQTDITGVAGLTGHLLSGIRAAGCLA